MLVKTKLHSMCSSISECDALWGNSTRKTYSFKQPYLGKDIVIHRLSIEVDDISGQAEPCIHCNVDKSIIALGTERSNQHVLTELSISLLEAALVNR